MLIKLMYTKKYSIGIKYIVKKRIISKIKTRPQLF
jgi:hypothetical protein